jgi:hypothetical protein
MPSDTKTYSQDELDDMFADTKTYSHNELDGLFVTPLPAGTKTYSQAELDDLLFAQLFNLGAADPTDTGLAVNYPIDEQLTMSQNEFRNSWDGLPFLSEPGTTPPFVEPQHKPAEIPSQNAHRTTAYFIDTNGNILNVRSPQDDTQACSVSYYISCERSRHRDFDR